MIECLVLETYLLTSHFWDTADNEKIHYCQCVSTKGENSKWLILLHGQSGSASAWKEFQKLAVHEGFNSLAIDLRGHGKSSRPEDISSFTIDQICDDIVGIIKSLKLQNFIFVGHCFGGMVAMKLIARKQLLVDKLVLVSSSLKSSLFGKISPAPKFMIKMTRTIASLIPQGTPKVIDDYNKYKDTNDINLFRLYADIRATTLKYFLLGYSEVFSFDARDIVEQLNVPILVIGGEKDVIHPVNVTQELGEILPNSQMIIMKNLNHLAPIRIPAELVNVVKKFTSDY